MTTKKDGRKTKQFALRASVNGTRVWENLTDEERKARIDRLQAGRRKWQAEKQAEGNKLVDEWINNEFVYRPTAKAIENIMKPRPLDIAKTNKAVDEWVNKELQHDTPDLDLGDVMMPDFAEQERRVRAKAAFDKVSVARASRVLVNGIKEVALREDDIEITADEEYVGISWQKLQSLVYQMMKEMNDE